MSNPILELHAFGQSVWYDNIQRALLQSGGMAAKIAAGEIRGVTSNPSIFNNAIANSPDYDQELRALKASGRSPKDVYEKLAIADIQAAADLFRPLYEQSQGGDGFVSLEVSPYLADDTEATCLEALRLWAAVDRPNLMVKIPATRAGLPAITRSIAAGVNVNVTLIFSQDRYLEVMQAYLAGLEQRVQAGSSIERVASVASFFVSRIDSKTDRLLSEPGRRGKDAELAASLMGKLAVANARLAYQQYKQVFSTDRFLGLKQRGGRVQRPLWASTSTKNPAYSDIKYVQELIGPETINTIPPATLDAFRDHGRAGLTLETGLDAAQRAFQDLAELGISFGTITAELEVEGVKAFADAFTALLGTIAKQM